MSMPKYICILIIYKKAIKPNFLITNIGWFMKGYYVSKSVLIAFLQFISVQS